MANFNQRLQDKLTRHALNLERLKNGAFRRYLPILQKIDAMIVGMFVEQYNGTLKQRREFIVELRKLKTETFAQFEKELIAELEALSKRQANFTFETIAGMLTDAMLNKAKAPDVQSIQSRGMTIKQQIDNLRNTSIKNTITTVNSTKTDGMTLKEATMLFRRTNRKEKAQARAVISTLVASVTTEADEAVIKANDRLIKGVKLSVVFDNRTTPICIQHSIEDRLYPVNDYPRPPFHYNCRTRALPVVKSWEELGANMKRRVPVRQRVSMTGDIAEDKTYADWLRRQPTKIIEDALGVRRARLFIEGEYKLERFIDPTGKFYDLDELFNRG